MAETPETREEQFLSAAAGNDVNLPKPLTREEMYLAKAAGVNINITVLDPITRKERYLQALAEHGGGGGDATLIDKSISANGVYNASSDNADGYKKVTVDVPNSYSAGDEGKVVSNGALVSQSSTTVSVNGTVDTSLNNEVVINVPNTYVAADEGKVVSNGALVAQTAHAKVTQNGTIDTTLNNSVVIDVPQGGDTPEPPDDGKTRIYIHLEKGRTSPMMGLGVNGTVEIDWGDGSAAETRTGTDANTMQYGDAHNYPDKEADYIITIDVKSGKIRLGGSNSSGQYSGVLRYINSTDNRNTYYHNAVRKIIVGKDTWVGQYAFRNLGALGKVVLPVDYSENISGNAFYSCPSLAEITIPSTITSLSSNAFYSCYGLKGIHFKSTTPPTIGSSSFSSLPADCIIYVPYSADHSVLAEYQGASNYPNPSTYTYLEE